MPTYEYKCPECNHIDLIPNYGGPPEDPECTQCGAETKRVYGSFGTPNMPTQAGRKMSR